MSEQNNSLINLGKLGDSTKVLIEKVSDAVGGIFKPYQIRRVAEAEAEADKIKAVSKIEITELQQRALDRFLIEEASRQANIESIVVKSFPAINKDAKPQNIEKDWIVDFFDKSRLISDEEMQEMWSRILAGEANVPGTYSKRTIHLLASLDKKDAILFSKLCSFVWKVGNNTIPLVFDYGEKIYKEQDINFENLTHLDSIGLINFDSLSGYLETEINKNEKISYQNTGFNLEFPKEKDNELNIGKVILSSTGVELSTICRPDKIAGLVDYVKKYWIAKEISFT